MFDEQMRSRFDEWIYILKNSKAPEKYTASGIKEAKARLDYLNMTPEERKKYDEYTDGKLSIDSALETAIKKGEKKGITKEKMRTVKKLLTENMDINKISEITEISVDRIKKIKIMKK
jgi:predicted transposase/invertase (TIGR01784 family)